MKVAVNCKDGKMRRRMGDADSFRLYEVKDGKVVGTQTIMTPEKHGAELFEILITHGVNVLITDGAGMSEIFHVRFNRIKMYGGVTGDADKAVEDLIAGRLEEHALASGGALMGGGGGGVCD